jgi:hypothetical protein
MAGARVGAHGAAASLTLVASKALAGARLAVTDTLAGALHVGMSHIVSRSNISKPDLERAHTLTAVKTLVVGVASALVVSTAGTCTTAGVGAVGHGNGQHNRDRRNEESSHFFGWS